MRRFLLPLLAALLGSAGIASAATDCRGTLTGRWVTKGDVDMGLAKVKVDNRDVYNADGSFRAVRRFVNQEGKWEEQVTSGQWTAKPGSGAGECVLEMSSKSEFGNSSSSTTVIVVDRNTFRSFGVDAKRVR
ncbi:conserved exported hypothetical protein [Bosea sp. 62]|uniref:hypothetical protein n=1 Tax=unclassified Bosea (in: a-proteobacteria) TaxID=2653178 RepID=UPI001258E9F4|nr:MULTISPECIES: hypothetical protein [unclassified Bosea (in: a-proteobacteria)]CAD5290717.1 conserved exported hypothetical protein [Bosea sp. 7B]CAD5300019.1 conserved exported hypothetical protein [Bosea sp. 21B]CAD5300532.1 conserved exported hypothetical protein [Bosea sp. 46]VVT61827.1 conserved exported hypothetical protein [Bosea sp. EC-HK365B]VXB42831.1 conserved exported hypothetical protein [Bosea sp. 125]